MKVKIALGVVVILAVLGSMALFAPPEIDASGSCNFPTCGDCLASCDAQLDFCIDGGWGGSSAFCQWQFEACQDDCIADCGC